MSFGPYDPINSPPPRTGNLTDDDIAGFLHDAANRLSAPANPLADFLIDLSKRYPFRVRQILRDHRWLAKQAKKRGFEFQ